MGWGEWDCGLIWNKNLVNQAHNNKHLIPYPGLPVLPLSLPFSTFAIISIFFSFPGGRGEEDEKMVFFRFGISTQFYFGLPDPV